MTGDRLTIAAERHCGRVGAATPLMRCQAYSRPPAIRKRAAAIKKGGMVWIPKRMAR